VKFKEVEWGSIDRIDLAQDRDELLCGIELLGSIKCRDFLI
jgi:hypothetical protein